MCPGALLDTARSDPQKLKPVTFGSARRHFGCVALFVPALVLAGCVAGGHSKADLAFLYGASARYHGPDRNPVIIIPGVLGSRLVDKGTGRIVWGAFVDDFADPTESVGARMISLPIERGMPPEESYEAVEATGALDHLDLNLFGLPLSVAAYRNILAVLGVGGYRDETLSGSGALDYGADHFTCFQFAYDWRLDNATNARRLGAFIEEKRDYVRGELLRRFGVDKTDIKFDIVAHSMGGLIARYFLRYGGAALPSANEQPRITWAGAEYVERVILVGTPNAGSLDALHDLIEGTKLAPLTPTYDAAIVGSFPSLYQMLPRGRHRALVNANTGQVIDDVLDFELWKRMRWGLADPRREPMLRILLPGVSDAAERREIALKRLKASLDLARRFMNALDIPATPPPGVDLYLFAGDAYPTRAGAEVSPATGELRYSRYGPGDGTVLRASALMDERLDTRWSPYLRSPIRWSGVTFLVRDHLGLTQEPEFDDNVLYLLLEAPRAH